MVVVLCGVWINSIGWVVSLNYRKLGVYMQEQVGFWLGSCTILFGDVTYSLCMCVVCVYRQLESRYVKVGDSAIHHYYTQTVGPSEALFL